MGLYQFADERGHAVFWYTFGTPLLESMSMTDGDTCAIAIDPYRLTGEADERYKMAHELGHCETGSFYNQWSRFDCRGKHELRANRWAIKKLLPREELYQAIKKQWERWEIADYFCVPEPLVDRAVEYYRMLDAAAS